MIRIRQADRRGRTSLDWLDSRHSFSFGGYIDRTQMGYGALRVINEDRVRPGAGFGRHPHRDMEILTWVLEGGLRHEDTLGNGSVIRAGDLQVMSAGTGIVHSEMNASDTAPVHFLQIWIEPERSGLPPGYQQRSFTAEELRNRLVRIAGRDGGDEVPRVHQDVELYAGSLEAGRQVAHDLAPGRQAWLQLTRGGVRVGGETLQAGDGAAIESEPRVEIEAIDEVGLLLFDLA